jgi:hypothetical protein
MRGFSLALVVAGLVGLAGCGTDNETEAEKAQKNLGAIPPTTTKGGEATPPPASYSQRQPPQIAPELQKQGGKKR